MQIFVHRNGENLGPYSVDQIKEMLGSKLLLPMDAAWINGEKAWKPLYQFLQFAPSPTQGHPMNPPESIDSPPAPAVTGYAESRTKNVLKRAIGALFLIIGVLSLFYGDTPSSAAGWVLFWLWEVFCMLGGLRWLLGNGEQHFVSMRARLALIFGLLLIILLPWLVKEVSAVAGEKAGAVAGSGTFVLLGIPTLLFGHSAWRVVANSRTLEGFGRTFASLLCAYLCLIGISVIDAQAFLSRVNVSHTDAADPAKRVSVGASPAIPAAKDAVITSPDALDMETMAMLRTKMQFTNIQKLAAMPARFCGKRRVIAGQEGNSRVVKFPSDAAPVITVTPDSLGTSESPSPIKSVFSGKKDGVDYIVALGQTGNFSAFWAANDDLKRAFPGADCTFELYGNPSMKSVLSVKISQ